MFVYLFWLPEARAVDALSLSWNSGEFLYLFPPPALVEKSLLLAIFAGMGILVHKLSPNSPLWSLLEERVLQSRPLLEPPGQFVRVACGGDCGSGLQHFFLLSLVLTQPTGHPVGLMGNDLALGARGK